MHIEVINTIGDFNKVRNNWESVYQADPNSLFFISWIWLAGILKLYDGYLDAWSILAAKVTTSDVDYVAFFPLEIGLNEEAAGHLYTELSVIGVSDAPHTTFICLPEYENEAASTFANYLKTYGSWSVLKISNVLTTDRRLNLFFEYFPKDTYTSHELHHANDIDCIDNNIVPYITLPKDWNSYLQTMLSSNTRQKVKRLLRRIEHNQEFQVTQVEEATLDQHLEILLSFWEKSWSGRKGDNHCKKILERTTFELQHCFQHSCLYLSILWQNNYPLGALANLVDWPKRTMLFFIGGRDESIKGLSPGLILQAVAIRHAIQNKFQIYDFLMGNEAYKFSLGAQERHIKIVLLSRQNKSQSSHRLDERTLPQALKVASIYHRANHLEAAEHSYRQILSAQSDHPEALYGLGVVSQRMGAHHLAEKCFEQLLELQPTNVKAWFSLGTLYQIQAQFPQAEATFRQALTLSATTTTTAAIHHNLGYLLQQKGDWDGAIGCYQQARQLQPDCIEMDVSWANAQYQQDKLSSVEQARYALLNQELGNQRRRANDVDSAIAYYRQAIDMQPDLAAAHYFLGQLLETKNDSSKDDIITCYRTAWRLRPNYREAEVALANVLYTQNKLSNVETIQYAVANYDLGHKYRQTYAVDSAIAYYRQAIRMKPDLSGAHYHLGLMLQLKGGPHLSEAITCYQAAQKLNPDDSAPEIRIATVRHQQGELSQIDQLNYGIQVYELGNQQKQASDLDGAIESYHLAIEMDPSLTDAREALRIAMQEHNNITIKISRAQQQ